MATRLDRLVLLLDTGSTPAIRLTAARQLGQVAALRVRGASSTAGAHHPAPSFKAEGEPALTTSAAAHDEGARLDTQIKKEAEEGDAEPQKAPSTLGETAYRGTDGEWDEVAILLARVLPYLRSKTWDTRIAAGQAIDHICQAAGIWDPDVSATVKAATENGGDPLTVKQEGQDTEEVSESNLAASGLLTFASFSLQDVLSTGTKLLSSAGKEYDTSNLLGSDRLAQAKRDMVGKLGLGFGAGMEMDLGMDVEAELRDGEEDAQKTPPASNTTDTKPAIVTPGVPPPRFAPNNASGGSLPPPRFAAGVAASPLANRRPSASPSTPPAALPVKTSSPTSSGSPGPSAVADAGDDDNIDMSKLSARERNQLKRKRKMEGKGGSAGKELGGSKMRIVEASAAPSSPGPSGIRIKTPSWQAATPGTAQTPMTPATPSGAPPGSDYLTARPQPPPAPKWPAAGPGAPPSVAGAQLTPTPGPSNAVANNGEENGAEVEPAEPAGAEVTVGGGSANAKNNAETTLTVQPGEWPFRLAVEVLSVDLFSPMWETRHGAALGLREIFKVQGSGGGKSLSASKAENDANHKAWCDDVAIKLLCVFALDRLGDFVFDQVIAPVRETASQTLASLLPHMPFSSVASVHRILLEMIRQDHLDDGSSEAQTADSAPQKGKRNYVWEVRHAGLLGLKYEVAVRRDLLILDEQKVTVKAEGDTKPDADQLASGETSASDMLRDVVDVAVLGLRDEDDDVRAVAAATLIPIADIIIERLPSKISSVLDQLWDCLGDLKDDLSSSTGGVMDLLAKLVEYPRVIDELNAPKNERSLSALIPRLYPFFRHTITSVRLSVLNALKVFLTVPSIPRDWVDDRVLRLLFQNLVVEERIPIREASSEAWSHAFDIVGTNAELLQTLGPHLPTLFRIIMTPLGSPIDFSLFFKPSGAGGHDGSRHNVDKGILAQDLALVGVDTVIRGRIGAAAALGKALARWPRSNDEVAFGALLREYLSSSSALQKCLAAAIVQEWAEAVEVQQQAVKDTSEVAADLSLRLIAALEAPPPATYAEMAIMLQRLQSECQGLYNSFARDAKLAKGKIPALPTTVDPLGHLVDAFTIDTAKHVAQQGFDSLLIQVGSKAKKAALPLLQDRQHKLIASIGFYQATKNKQDIQVYASVAGAVIALQVMPAKLNPVIRSIMNSVKFEENLDLQTRSARAVANFIAYCVSPNARANPSDKIVKNLCAFVCQDTTRTAIFTASKGVHEGILSMVEAPVKAGRGGAKDDSLESEEVIKGRLIRRGAELTLAEVAARFGQGLFEVVPTLWECMTTFLLQLFSENDVATADQRISQKDEQGQGVLDCCTVLQTNVPNLASVLHERVVALLPALTSAIQSRYAVIRSAASKCFSVVGNVITDQSMRHLVEEIVPLLGDASNVINRQGAVELISHVVEILDIKLLPYVIFLVVPILGRMSDADDKVRLVATNTFASLVKMVPLEAGLPNPPGFSEDLLRRREDERKFLMQLLDGNKVEPYQIPVKINAELRKYQQDGINWMAFLAKYQLHGILCDDMGLGKTLQSICILSSKHYERAEKFKATKSPEATPLPSLIVCPPTLTGHWYHEIKQYSTNLRPMLYSGQPTERTRLQGQITKFDAVVMSYDVVRNDIAALSKVNWNYCILDEGHIIKSAKTKTTKAVKMIRANHRLILSGTPIQNNVLELWSLFDFLMPGFLGSERTFHERFGKPIIASRDGKLSSREQEAAALALEALHKQVLPFLLRRLKEDVLEDLPPKIIQDIECDLGEVQKQLYEDFTKSQDKDELENAFDGDSTKAVAAPGEKHHVFQTLQYLRKLVNHPALIFNEANERHKAIKEKLISSGSSLHDIANAPKLQALRQLLHDCGIGNPVGTGENDTLGADAAVSQHRVLIFCQLKQMLDIIETDLFKALMPSVSYMRLDGGVSADKRHGIVQTFNADPSIDVLLLTTQVGGLGLTLTGADTVIFVEHDWNPMKDLQAMDRAHRLGQKKVVNVYRLITRNTLEAKIMGLQRFKLNVANSVVTQQNNGLESMDTDQILDLFDSSSGDPNAGSSSASASSASGKFRSKGKGGISQKALLDSLENMPDSEEAEYASLQWQPGS